MKFRLGLQELTTTATEGRVGNVAMRPVIKETILRSASPATPDSTFVGQSMVSRTSMAASGVGRRCERPLWLKTPTDVHTMLRLCSGRGRPKREERPTIGEHACCNLQSPSAIYQVQEEKGLAPRHGGRKGEALRPCVQANFRPDFW